MFKILNYLVAALCYSPYVYLFGFYSMVLNVALKIGRLPRYNDPDPRSLDLSLHKKVLELTFEITSYALLTLIVLLIAGAISKKLDIRRMHWIFLIIGILLIIFNLFVDPLTEWYAD